MLPGTSDQLLDDDRSDDCCSVNPSPFQKRVAALPSINRFRRGEVTIGLLARSALPKTKSDPVLLWTSTAITLSPCTRLLETRLPLTVNTSGQVGSASPACAAPVHGVPIAGVAYTMFVGGRGIRSRKISAPLR